MIAEFNGIPVYLANEWIVYPCHTHVSFQMNAISLCVIILSSIKILATIPLFMLSLHNSFMLFAVPYRVPRLVLQRVFSLALSPPISLSPTAQSFSPPVSHFCFRLTPSLTHYLLYMYVSVCDAFYCWLNRLMVCWFVDSDIGLTSQFNWLSTACGVAKFAEHIYCRIHFRWTIYQSPCFRFLLLLLLFTCFGCCCFFGFVLWWTETENNSDGTMLYVVDLSKASLFIFSSVFLNFQFCTMSWWHNVLFVIHFIRCGSAYYWWFSFNWISATLFIRVPGKKSLHFERLWTEKYEY